MNSNILVPGNTRYQ